ncbi:hypothetical protein D3C86_1616380 [compost metagenome]
MRHALRERVSSIDPGGGGTEKSRLLGLGHLQYEDVRDGCGLVVIRREPIADGRLQRFGLFRLDHEPDGLSRLNGAQEAGDCLFPACSVGEGPDFCRQILECEGGRLPGEGGEMGLGEAQQIGSGMLEGRSSQRSSLRGATRPEDEVSKLQAARERFT